MPRGSCARDEGSRHPRDLIIRIGRRLAAIRRAVSARVKARAVGALLYTHFNARADNWPGALLASSIRKHLIGFKALITALNCANARFYPY